MSTVKLSDYKSDDSLFTMFFTQLVLEGLGWGLALLALLSIVGIILVPFLIIFQIFSSRYLKKRVNESNSQALLELEQAGFVVTRELVADEARILIDEGNQNIAYWGYRALSFKPGIAHLNEITELGFIKDGDSIIQDPLFEKVQTRRKGKTVFAIKFNRIDQPIFKFGMKSQDRADTLLQQLCILTNRG